MKKRLSIFLSFAIACLFVSSLMFGGCKSNSIIKWDNLRIANFDNYHALGAGCLDVNSQKGEKNLHVAYAEEIDEEGEVKLIGITGAGECEEITFVNEEGEISKQNARLIWFDAYTRYSFACFSTEKDAEYVSETKLVKDWDFYCLSYEITATESGMVNVSYGYDYIYDNGGFSGYFFIIDNVTGKIYDVAKVLEKVVSENKYNKISFINMEKDFDYIMCLSEDNRGVVGESHELYFINFKDTSLEVERKMDVTQVNNFTEGETFYCNSGMVSHFANDKFGNIFQRVTHDGYLKVISSFTNGLLYQKTSGLFTTLSLENDEECFLAINGVVYKTKYAYPIGTENNTPIKRWYLNENSEFVEINNLEEIMHYAYWNEYYENDLLKTNDTTYRLILNRESEWLGEQLYYYYSLILQSSTMVGVDELSILNKEQTIYSKTYLSESNHSEWTDALKEFVLYNGIIIGKIGNEILTININNGNSENLFNNYDIKDYFYSKHLDCLKFTAIDKNTLLEVEGFYNKDGQVTIGEFPTDMESLKKIYSIAPLN